MASFSQWRVQDYPAGDSPFNITSVGGPQPYWRDPLDLARSGWRATPEATYPDGYLGTLNTRRQDRLLDGLKSRQDKAKQRGVHKGEKRDSSEYFWPPEFNPMSGLVAESMGMRFVSPAIQGYDTSVLVNDGKRGPRGVPTGGTARWDGVSPVTNTDLRRMAPPWGTPDMVVAYNGRG